jgi:hypothetical protein
MAVTVGELKGYWKKVADAVSSNKMNVTDTDILAALMAIGQTIEDVEAEIQAIKSTEGIKKIADAVKVTADDNTIAGLGALAAAAVTDPAASASVIALLKGMLKQLQGTGTGAAPVQLTGSKVQVDTLLNSVSIPAGDFQVFNIDPTSEDEIWLLISIDKQPWTLSGNNLIYPNSDGGQNMFFPARAGMTTTHNIYTPCVTLCLGGLNLATAWGLTPPTSMTEARQYMITPYQADLRARLVNNSSAVATATVKAVRVWKKG